ncbi:hypothetical protein OQJ18_12615 [Fluoribacter dumoffii]|uniref:hypothetical protein n=1 Tax=Fluoribacter dumoffii TaxID=463 RepID=UPI0022435A97|nr:hypothetical protein [Fluoribacter dumoffii]MCW8417062.1 hypothetical protein [Fluoribacter dumoffii]MCW8455098.1 hypothetical protein [Fluoribacter dumoffii]MCW8460825.1 hypothetical protein [Fluoribacter dumoffii]MCW8484267.1 hypothetical protein [Fluoribacter dumoffii]
MELKIERQPKVKLNREEKFSRDYEEEIYDGEYLVEDNSHSPARRGASEDDSIFDACLGTTEVKANARRDIKAGANKAYEAMSRAVPGFFAPFGKKPLLKEMGLSTGKEIGLVGTAPITAPLVMALSAGLLTAVAAGAAITALGSLIFAAGAELHSLRKGKEAAKETASDALIVSAKAGIVAAFCILAAAAAALVAAIIAPIALAYFITRSGASAVSAISECNSSNEEESRYSRQM